MRHAIAIAALLLSFSDFAAAETIETPAFQLSLSADWKEVQTGDREQRAAYSKEKGVGLTASYTLLGARPSDTERIAQKLKEFRVKGEQSAADRFNLKMTIADPIVKSFAQGHSSPTLVTTARGGSFAT